MVSFPAGDTLAAYATGERPRAATGVVVAVAAVAAVSLAALGAMEAAFGDAPSGAVFMFVVGPLPVAAGAVCGWFRLGFPAAAVSGVSTGVAFYVVVAVGAAVDVGGFGGGDTPLAAFSMVLASTGLVWATGGFVAGVIANLATGGAES
ncbi:uncharacterized protein NP_4108A [Natronomonas pharaonis DSM 2160]|uniref:Uncharacterized protein n=1 Tax=Natronomonas pharaonis (strain ATCC 35678 / DSM 2160 / CIP 103997 / JCM 8858 / NBRC 14720 / NCIMB 2260 / Gabara) TaxID=348780 RepID=A0A1U7EY67_NATPD|nr:hypothetical protein [Natronomonas pharaonis]CAI50145.1 uncharacterized protein NP_4108A [Natronomonas pharaonis DSM 2160]